MLRVSGLSVAYGSHEVLRGVDLEVRSGEVVGLVGPNGCGKTTLLRAIGRLVAWQAGAITVGGASIASLKPRELARAVAIVPQNPQLPAGYTAAEIVLMGRTAHLGLLGQEGPEDLRKAMEALQRTGGQALAQRRVDDLSGGERQLVLLARALAQEAPLLLLDEPTANLDIGHQIAFAELVRSLATSGLAVLAAIHDLTLASLHCDRLALMAEGRIVAEGAPGAVLTPANIAAAYGARPLLRQDAALPGPIVAPWEDDAPAL